MIIESPYTKKEIETINTLIKKTDITISELGHRFNIGKVYNYEVGNLFAEDWRFFVVTQGIKDPTSGDYGFSIHYYTEQKDIDIFIKNTLSNHIKDELFELSIEYGELKTKQKEEEDRAEYYSLFSDYNHKIINRSEVDYDRIAIISKRKCELSALLEKYSTKEQENDNV